MKLLVIGGSGFLSSTVVRAGLAAGHETWALSRGNKPIPAGARALTADRTNRAAFSHAVAGGEWDLVVDCIGFNAGDAQQDIEAFAGRAGRLVFVSTDFVLSAAGRPWRVDETFDRYTDSPYGAGKRAAEEALLASDPRRLPLTILRPGHILGPGSQLGCLPRHGRDPRLIERLRAGETLRLVGGGHFLQQPVFAPDLAAMILSCADKTAAISQIYMAPGPDIVESIEYYRIVARLLGVELNAEECSIAEFLAEQPVAQAFCCHRVYSSEKAAAHGLAVPATPLAEALRIHVESMLRESGAGTL